jgi:RNA polymerase sigma-70 factor (ECF subfamily)
MDRDLELGLVARLKCGDEGAFDTVYAAFRAPLFSFVLRLVARRAIAEELSQEAWLRVAATAHRLHDDTRLAPWLFTVARNLCLSHWRSHGGGEPRAVPVGAIDVPDHSRPSPEGQAEGGELHRRLERALARMALADREVLLLVGVEGMAPAEAAQVIGIRPDALRKRLQRARDRLALVLESDQGEAGRRRGAT